MASGMTWGEASLVQRYLDQPFRAEFFTIHIFGVHQAIAIRDQQPPGSISIVPCSKRTSSNSPTTMPPVSSFRCCQKYRPEASVQRSCKSAARLGIVNTKEEGRIALDGSVAIQMPVQVRNDLSGLDLRVGRFRQRIPVSQDVAAQCGLQFAISSAAEIPFPLMSASAMASRVGEMRIKS